MLFNTTGCLFWMVLSPSGRVPRSPISKADVVVGPCAPRGVLHRACWWLASGSPVLVSVLSLRRLGIRILARLLYQAWMGTLSAILFRQRFSTQIKVIGIFLFLHPIVTTGFHFTLIWLGISSALTL